MAADENYIKQLIDDRRQVYGDFHKEVLENRAARALKDFTIDDVPDAYRTSSQVVNLPRIPDTLQRMVAICTDDDPVISVPPPDETEKSKRNTSLRERWLAGSNERMTNDAGRDAWRMAMDAALGDGLGIMKLTDDKTAWNDEPERRKDGDDEEDAKEYLSRVETYRKGAPFPFILTDVDCLTYFPVYTGRRIAEVVEVTKRLVVPTAKALGVKPVSRSNGKTEWKKLRLGERFPNESLPAGMDKSVEVAEHWDATHVSYMFDGILVDQRKHGYKQPPYFPFGGYTTSSRDPALANRSVVASMRPLVKALNRWLTMLSNIGYVNAFPFLKKDPQSTSLTPQQETVKQIQPGDILQGVDFMQMPAASADLKEIVKMLMAESDRAGLSAVMYGYQGGTTSGYQVASLQAAAQSVLKPVLRNAATALEQLFYFQQFLIDKVMFDGVKTKAGKVYVWGRDGEKGKSWLGLGPDDIDGYYYVKVDLKPLLPLDEIAQRDSALRMVQGGLWSKRYALEKTGEEQPEVLIDEIAVEKYLERPEINDRISYDAAVAAGVIKPEPPTPPMDLGAPQGMPPGAPGGIGGPGMPGAGPIGVPVPGAGLPLQPTPNMATQMANGPQPGGMPQGGPEGM